jgi:hypothetical protein
VQHNSLRGHHQLISPPIAPDWSIKLNMPFMGHADFNNSIETMPLFFSLFACRQP